MEFKATRTKTYIAAPRRNKILQLHVYRDAGAYGSQNTKIAKFDSQILNDHKLKVVENLGSVVPQHREREIAELGQGKPGVDTCTCRCGLYGLNLTTMEDPSEMWKLSETCMHPTRL